MASGALQHLQHRCLIRVVLYDIASEHVEVGLCGQVHDTRRGESCVVGDGQGVQVRVRFLKKYKYCSLVGIVVIKVTIFNR